MEVEAPPTIAVRYLAEQHQKPIFEFRRFAEDEAAVARFSLATSVGLAIGRFDPCILPRRLYLIVMRLSIVQDQSIAARMALIVGAKTFDRLFSGIRFDEVDGDILFVYATDEDCAAEIEDNFALHISIVATDILKQEVGIVLVLPRELADPF